MLLCKGLRWAQGGALAVTATALNYGSFGQIVETLPVGFSYTGSDLSEAAVEVEGRTISFILQGERSVTYTVAAPSSEGSQLLGKRRESGNQSAPGCVYIDIAQSCPERGGCPMKATVKTALLSVVGIWIVLVAAVACQSEPGPSNTTLEVVSGRKPDSSVSGTVTYRERLALTPGATLVVELRDVSHVDVPAPLIARQTISGPGQVPIKFKVGYNRSDISSRNRYAIIAKIVESDGRLAFINDTAYEVITQGKPGKVDMLLVLAQPPSDLVGGSNAGSDWQTWVEVSVPVAWANLVPNEPEPMLRVAYYQSTIEGCARPGNQELQLDGYDIIARVTLMQPPPTP